MVQLVLRITSTITFERINLVENFTSILPKIFKVTVIEVAGLVRL